MSRSGFPCFQGGGDRAVRALAARFAPALSEGEVVSHVLSLIGAPPARARRQAVSRGVLRGGRRCGMRAGARRRPHGGVALRATGGLGTERPTGHTRSTSRPAGDSLDAWSTRQYDSYQRVLNGIL